MNPWIYIKHKCLFSSRDNYIAIPEFRCCLFYPYNPSQGHTGLSPGHNCPNRGTP